MMNSNCMGSFPKMRKNFLKENSGNDSMNACFSMMSEMCNSELSDSKACCEQEESVPKNLSTLFKEWYKSLEEEVIKFAEEHNDINEDAIAKKFKLSRESVQMLLISIDKKKKSKS